MARDEPELREEDIADILAGFDEALAKGEKPLDASYSNSVPAGLRIAVERNLSFLRLLDQLRPQSKPPSTQANDSDTLHARSDVGTAGERDSVVLGEYQLLNELGRGGMGTVYRARHVRMDRIVAVKLLRSVDELNPDAVRRFHREIQAAAKLAHPNIVHAYDASERNGTPFLVMEYVDGIDLARHVRANGPLPVALAVDYVIQAARGLAYAHDQGIVHRDVKPHNLLLDSTGTIKILDMGLAHFRSSARPIAANDDHSKLTNTGVILGTVDYLAPEQAANARKADQRADIYSLGCTLHYLLTGDRLFHGETIVETLLLHCTKPPASLRSVRPEVSPTLDQVFLQMTMKDPEDRFASMHDVIRSLQAVGDDQREDEAPKAKSTALSSVLVQGALAATFSSALGIAIAWMPSSKPAAVEPAVQEEHSEASKPSAVQRIAPPEVATPSAAKTKPVKPDFPALAAAPFTPVEARKYQDDWARRLGVPVAATNRIGIKTSLIPAGSCPMGTPARTVTITRPYYLGIHEVTVGQFRQFVNATNYRTNAEDDGNGWGFYDGQWRQAAAHSWRNLGRLRITDDLPAGNISWNDATAFCNWLSKSEPGYRLPTEAEWEFACRAGSMTAWSFGSNPARMSEYAWHRENSANHPHPVGRKLPNPFGLFDMYGNEWERCFDYLGPYDFSMSSSDPRGPATGQDRILRGGGFGEIPSDATSSTRRANNPRDPTNGSFRVARDIPIR